jgi:superfamily II DNA or RNA helicase
MSSQDDRVRELESKLEEALAAVRDLRYENDLLRARVVDRRPESTDTPARDPMPLGAVGTTIGRDSSEAEKITLFRSLFRGRDDVYAYRWESRDGRSGYAPALRPGAKREKGQRPDPSVLLPFDDSVAQSHLTGQKVIGVYPLLEDETCWLLAIDFDKSSWQEDVREVLATCDYLGAPAALERSRSGRGAHLWVFFNSPVAAATARNLGCALLTRALDKRHQIGFDSYDRLFPNQDTMPRGGFGNLIALPLQRVARHSGNTEFLDRDFQPFPDQWKFLASIPRLTATDCERIVRDAAREGMILGIEASWFETEEQAREPWTLSPSRHRRDAPIAGPMPAAVEVVMANRVFIPKPELPPAMLSRLRRLAVFQNPEFYRAQAMRLSTWDKPRVIDCSEDFPDHLALPRGTLAEVLKVFEKQGVWVNLKDERQGGTSVALSFKGELTEDQRVAAEALVAHDIGVLVAPTAFGKTVIGAWLIAKRGVNTLVLVHRQQLADQWRERLAAFLDIPTRSIGQFGAGRNKGKGTIDIGMLQSLSAKGEVRDVVADYGQVLIDECHHVPAVTFERVLSEVRARYVTGLTATPTRKDGHDPILVLQCGPIRHRVDARAQAEAQPFEHVVVPRLTSFALSVDAADAGIQEIYSRLVDDQARTDMIVTDVLEAVGDGRAPLVLTERTEHLERMQELLASRVENLIVLRGGMGAGERKAVAASLKSIPDHSPRVLLATGRYIGEGFDDARLDSLFLALPVSWKGTIQQYAGRLHRLHERKRAVTIFDYVDVHVPMLARMYQKRLRGYAAIGYLMAAGNTTPTLRSNREM